MAGKEHKEAVSAQPRASSLRSAKRSPSDAELHPVENDAVEIIRSALEHNSIQKRAEKCVKLSCEAQPNVDHILTVKIEEDSTKMQKPKKKRKPFKGFVKRRKAPKKCQIDLKLINCDPILDVKSLAALEDAVAVNTIDQVNVHCLSENGEVHTGLEERHITSIPAYESPRKTRINAPKLQACTNCTSPRKTSRHWTFNPFDLSHIKAVKTALHLSTIPDTLICRDAEQSKVFEFCKGHLLEQRSGSLYICGCPGTGKSLLMEKVKLLASKWAEEGELAAPEICTFNCTSLTNPSDIFDQILRHVLLHQGQKPTKSCKAAGLAKLKLALCKPGTGSVKQMLLLIVDEIDYLVNKDRSILHELFELPAQTNSRCILIGISNSIDLADRCLQNLNSLSCHPVVIPFSPYTKDQLIAVLNQRMKELPFSVFQPAALELCARKVAAASGDMRKALHVCRIAVELLESENKTGDEKPAQNGAHPSKLEAPSTPSKKIGNPDQNKQDQHLVQIHHMAQALAKTFRSAAVDTVKALPKHQQMVLCAAVRLFRQNKKDTTLGQLNVKYVDFCKATGMPALSVPEFSSVCRVLVDQGLLNLGTSREERLKRVTLRVDEDDIVFALQAIRFFCNNLT